jgi:hypothetical protein
LKNPIESTVDSP